MIRVHNLPRGQVDVSRSVLLFDPGFVEFVADTEDQREVGADFVVVLGKTCNTPLALSNVDTG